jgi:hypothetical protein
MFLNRFPISVLRYGEVVDVNLVRDKTTGKSRGFAFRARVVRQSAWTETGRPTMPFFFLEGHNALMKPCALLNQGNFIFCPYLVGTSTICPQLV